MREAHGRGGFSARCVAYCPTLTFTIGEHTDTTPKNTTPKKHQHKIMTNLCRKIVRKLVPENKCQKTGVGKLVAENRWQKTGSRKQVERCAIIIVWAICMKK
jgi:hypothetical protein